MEKNMENEMETGIIQGIINPKGPSTQQLDTCDLGNSKYSTGFG